jgi:CYTH domain-containing protein
MNKSLCDTPIEIERKFLIEYPDIDWLENNPACRRAEIVQTYLNSDSDEEVRIRKRCENGICVYYKTVKTRVTDIKRVEIESVISEAKYLDLLLDADSSMRTIYKTRYCLEFNNRVFEIDVYPFWKDKAVAEIELENENENIIFPKEIKVIKEVTYDKAYKNSSLAKI